jgi:hypothetical protein
LSNLIIQALKAIGEKNVSEEQIEKIQKIINDSQERELIYKNLLNAPVWMRKFIVTK